MTASGDVRLGRNSVLANARALLEPACGKRSDGETAACQWYRLADLLNDPTLTAAPSASLPPIGYAGRLTLLAGREKQGGKSTTLGAAVAHASQSGVRCLVVTLDEPLSDTVQRLQRFGANPDNVFLVCERPDDSALEAVVEVTGVHNVAIDSLERWAAGRVTESGSAVQWGAVLAPLQRIARTRGVAVILLHHASKATGQYRDSTAIGAAVDLIITLVEKPDGSRRATVQGRFPVPDFTVTLDANGLPVFTIAESTRSTISPAPITDAMKAGVLRVLQSAEPEGLKATAWKLLAKEVGISGTSFYRARRLLDQEGLALHQSTIYRVSPSGTQWIESQTLA